MKTDINDDGDIVKLVDAFYERAAKDELLGPIFRTVHARSHKEALYRYWGAALLSSRIDRSESFPQHIELMFSTQHFIRWLTLFLETIDILYSGQRVEKAKVILIKKSEEFQLKLALSRF